jgi:arsenite-transporting ATPase
MNEELKNRILPDGSTKFVFFGGKGGVGKTTTATATAIWFADHGYDTTIVSTDPTVSLSVVLGQEIGGKERTEVRQVPNLRGLNINPKDSKGRYKSLFEHVMGAVNKEAEEEPLQSPCAEEMATFDQFVGFLDEPESEVIVFDTAPTGKTLREIAMPFNYADFIQKQIKDGKELAKLMNLSEEADETLEKDKARYERAMAVLRDQARTVFNLVLLPERLPIEETASALSGLSHLDIVVQSLLVNQVIPREVVVGNSFLEDRVKLQSRFLNEIGERFPGLLRTELPMLAKDVSDLAALRRVGASLYGN